MWFVKFNVNLIKLIGNLMNKRDLNKEFMRAVQKQDLDSVERILKFNKNLKTRRKSLKKSGNTVMTALINILAKAVKKNKRT